MTRCRTILPRAATLVAALATLGALAACSTINQLDRYELRDAPLAVQMRVPPPATLDVGYSTHVYSGNIIGSAISVGTTVIKAAEAAKARERMQEALRSVDVPAIVLQETSSGAASALSARLVPAGRPADYLLDLDIYEYGIDAPSWASAVSLHLGMAASLYAQGSGDIAWRRKHLSVDIPARAQMFGVGAAAGDIVTAAMLASLSVRELEEGFRRLALESAAHVTRTLEDDLYRARYGRRR